MSKLEPPMWKVVIIAALQILAVISFLVVFGSLAASHHPHDGPTAADVGFWAFMTMFLSIVVAALLVKLWDR